MEAMGQAECEKHAPFAERCILDAEDRLLITLGSVEGL